MEFLPSGEAITDLEKAGSLFRALGHADNS
jgi:hypothetical protein